MSSPSTTIFRFGWVGVEQEIRSTIKTKVVFALADHKQKLLAWYVYGQTVLYGRQGWFDDRGLTGTPLDRNAAFGDLPSHPPAPHTYNFPVDLAKLAPQRVGQTPARLTLFDYASRKETGCELSIDSVPTPITLNFRLTILAPRRTMDIVKPGLVWLVDTEAFSGAALKRGPKSNWWANPIY
jgi:hypothetical protein